MLSVDFSNFVVILIGSVFFYFSYSFFDDVKENFVVDVGVES